MVERYVSRGTWVLKTVGDVLRVAARRAPDRIALVEGSRSVSYGEYNETTDRLGAALLQVGLHPGDRVLFQMGNSIETAFALLACFKAGLIPVCTLPQHREVEITSIAAITGAAGYIVQGDASRNFDLVGFAKEKLRGHATLRHLIVARGTVPLGAHALEDLISDSPRRGTGVAPTHPPTPQDVMIFQLSGGTTGAPKVIPRVHAEFLGYCNAWNQLVGSNEADVGLWALPLIHNAAMIYHLIPSILQARKLILMERFDVASFFRLIERERVTMTGSIGPVAAKILDYPDVARHNLSSVRLFTTLSRAEEIERHLRVPVINVYGISEGVLTGSHPRDPAEVRHRTVGRPVSPDDEFRLLAIAAEQDVPEGSIGELAFRGPSMIHAYYGGDADILTAEGFFRTGDLMRSHRINGQIYYSFEGRIKDNIDRGGEKFGPEEIETVIVRHPAVADVRVVSMPDAVYGEKPCAFIILHSGFEAPSPGELGAFLLDRGIAGFKVPERIEVLEEFPQTRVGKIDRAALRGLAARLVDSDAAVGKTTRQVLG
jgi:non-ribosomal peptide synthetase component E (peptide arylation enzyme)